MSEVFSDFPKQHFNRLIALGFVASSEHTVVVWISNCRYLSISASIV